MHLLRHKPDGDFELVTFSTNNLPPYAILSHTWTDGEEVTYDELMKGSGKAKAGYDKIRFCGEQAVRDGLQYFWVDTCCINKLSSAELSESINSMYRWYQQAEICYAYIEDWTSELTWEDIVSIVPVHESESEGSGSEAPDSEDDVSNEPQSERHKDDEPWFESNENKKIRLEHFAPQITGSQERRTKKAKHQDSRGCSLEADTVQVANSVQESSGNEVRYQSAPSTNSGQSESLSSRRAPLRWFTRGWTLQELIAPKKMTFFGSSWKLKGVKSESTVVHNLSRITGIASDVLHDRSGEALRDICLGQRMSWAAYRETSRVEDIAYCLLGIFQINMPLIYGEGEKAFFRLQEEILASSTDLSLLAWSQPSHDPRAYRGIFSSHPCEYQGLGKCRLDKSQFSVHDEIIMTNKGARIETSLFHMADNDGQILPIDVQFLSLGCYVDDEYLQGIFLIQMKDFHVRAQPDGLMRITKPLRRARSKVVYLARDFDGLSNLNYNLTEAAGIKVRFEVPGAYTLRADASWPCGYYNHLSDTFLVGHISAFVGYLSININKLAPSDSEHQTKSVGRFMAVIVKGGYSNVLMNLLNQHQAEELENYVTSITPLDSPTAHSLLVDHLMHLWRDPQPAVLVQDTVANTLLRIEGEVVDRKPTRSAVSGELFTLKAVKISINVDSETKVLDHGSEILPC